MSNTVSSLPNDPAILKAMIAALEAENSQLQEDADRMAATLRAHEALVQALQIQIARLRKQKFGASSEKIEREIEQLELSLEFLEVAAASNTEAEEDENASSEPPSAEAPEQKPRRRKPRVSDDTPRERIVLDPGEACPDCGGTLRPLGEDVSEILELVTATLKVIEIARLKKSCRRCEKITQPPAPSRSIPRSMVGPGLLAHILVAKFDDHLPLYRQNEIFARMGADIPSSTLVDWCGQGMRVLAPLIARIREDIMTSDRLHAPSRQIASQSPAGQWTIRPSKFWIPPDARAVLARGSKKGGSGLMCAMTGHGAAAHRLGRSITSRPTGRANIHNPIWPSSRAS